MEKKIMKHIILFSISVLAMAACTDFAIEDQGFDLEELPGYVSFGNDGGTVDPAEDGADEGESASFKIQVPTGSLSDITVDYTLGGSATFGTDYTIDDATAAGGSILLRHDNRTSSGDRDVNDFAFVDINITALHDAQADADETVVITLTRATGADGTDFAIGRGGTDIQRQATLTIGDVPIAIGFENISTSTTETSKDTTQIVFTSNFDAPEDVTITMAVSGNAVLGTDYTYETNGSTPLGTSFVLPQGESSVAVDNILVVNDVLKETKDSTVYVVTAVSIAGSGNVVSIDTDADSLLHKVSDESKVIAMETQKSDTLRINSIDDVGNYVFDVSLSSTSTQTISVDYIISGGTAGVDYNDVTGGTISFVPGQAQSKITIEVLSTALGSVKTLTTKLDDTSIAAGTDTEVEVLPDSESNNEFNIKIEQ